MVKQEKLSYNDWLRDQNLSSSDTFLSTRAKLLVVLQELEFLCSQEIIMEPSRISRIVVAMEHLIIEIRLLDTSKVRAMEGL